MSHYITYNDKKIYVETFFPTAQSPVPVIIFSHGFNGSHADFRIECEQLVKSGIGCIALDFCGGSNSSKSSGSTTEMTLLTEKEDLKAVLDYASQLEQTDPERIYLFGGSQGGMVSALLAEDEADRIAGLMLLYPAFCIPDDWQKRFPRLEDIPETENLWGVELGRGYFETVHGWDIFRMVGKYSGPVLIFHGDADDIVSVDYAREAAKRYPHAQYKEYAGEGHGFTREGMDDVTKLAEAFVKKSC